MDKANFLCESDCFWLLGIKVTHANTEAVKEKWF